MSEKEITTPEVIKTTEIKDLKELTLSNKKSIDRFNFLINKYIPGTKEGYRIIQFTRNEENYEKKKIDRHKNEIFENLLKRKNPKDLQYNEIKEQKLLKLLLKIKNGMPLQRKNALKQISNKSHEFGPSIIFHHILPLMMIPNLEEHERHLLVKVIDRILIRLKYLIRPYVSKILLIVEPLLLEDDYFARTEAREIIASLSKAVGLATMLTALRPDVDNTDEFVRFSCARSLSVVGISLGVNNIIPFIEAVCKSKKSWQARHTGIKVIQQIAILLKSSVRPYVKKFLEIIKHGILDENERIRTLTALTISQLADSIYPNGIEFFHDILQILWKGIKISKNKTFAAFLNAISSIIRLMDTKSKYYYLNEIMGILKLELNNPDLIIKKTLLKIIKFLSSSKKIHLKIFTKEVYKPFFSSFLNKKILKDKYLLKEVKQTTELLAVKVGPNMVISDLLEYYKSNDKTLNSFTVEILYLILTNKNHTSLLNENIKRQLFEHSLLLLKMNYIDEQGNFSKLLCLQINFFFNLALNSFNKIAASLKNKLTSINPDIRKQASEIISHLDILRNKEEFKIYSDKFLIILFESMNEENQEVLAVLLNAFKKLYDCHDFTRINPTPKILMAKIIPILKCSNVSVKFNTIELINIIARKAGLYITPKEWMRIGFDLLEIFKAKKKSVRRIAINTFGQISKIIGPIDLMTGLISNLKVQDRHIRICTTVAMAVISESCSPFTTLPYLMKEYQDGDTNIENGVLKALAFIFEYIGEISEDYVYGISSLIEKAMTHSNLVHRQICCNILQVKIN
mmetsp:Transcript_7544/g.10645  ORF Transcript_7544/g.10645 Transcript_7544/m.10645 type:complete len:799 (+) Transcript_7544:63-2459(+)